ncbi:hypothetical protein [Streptomyces sp. NPDC101115]|uniref:hypothetical protein n=1 Tax=Streptomyces sp. NPDC101115 TaxID=3366106 RepID=UPI0037F9C9EE
MVQVAFPFTLAEREVKNVLLAVMIAEHLGTAVVLGIPFLSPAVVVCDAVFLLASITSCDSVCQRVLTALAGRGLRSSSRVLKAPAD